MTAYGPLAEPDDPARPLTDQLPVSHALDAGHEGRAIADGVLEEALSACKEVVDEAKD